MHACWRHLCGCPAVLHSVGSLQEETAHHLASAYILFSPSCLAQASPTFSMPHPAPPAPQLVPFSISSASLFLSSILTDGLDYRWGETAHCQIILNVSPEFLNKTNEGWGRKELHRACPPSVSLAAAWLPSDPSLVPEGRRQSLREQLQSLGS